MISVTDLQPGDVLLYRPAGIFGWLIGVKTWHFNVSHCEVYDGDGYSWASRDGLGVNRYPWRPTQLAYVLRPTMRLNLAYARIWARRMIGTPYGWLDLLAFFGLPIDFPGIICSAFLTRFFRMAGWNLFPMDAANDIAPFEFLELVGAGFTVVFQA